MSYTIYMINNAIIFSSFLYYKKHPIIYLRNTIKQNQHETEFILVLLFYLSLKNIFLREIISVAKE